MTPQLQQADAAAEPGGGGLDRAQLEALRAGDERAFLALVQRYHAAMVRTAQAYVTSRSVAEEAAQEAWLGVLEGLSGFEGRCSLKTWIFRILVNCAKTRGRREARARPLSSLESPEEDEGSAEPADRFRGESEHWAGHWARPPLPWPEEQVASQEMARLVREAMEALPAAQREVMTLRDVEGWDSAEVCELLGLSEGNQRVLLHRARVKVRRSLEERLAQEGRS